MNENESFTNLLTEVASRLGVEVRMTDDEELTFDFEDGLTASISHDADRRQIILEAGILPPAHVSDGHSADLAGLLLRMNTLLMPEQSMATAISPDERITVIRVAPQETLNAIQLADLFEDVVEQARSIQTITQQVVFGTPDSSDNDIPEQNAIRG